MPKCYIIHFLFRTVNPSDEKKKAKKKRPLAKLFDPEKVRSIGGEIANDGDFLVFEGGRFSRKGYLYKNFAMNAILAEGVKPSLTELERFEEAPEGIDIELSSTTDKEEHAHTFSNGDNVEVIEGELIHLKVRMTLSTKFSLFLSMCNGLLCTVINDQIVFSREKS